MKLIVITQKADINDGNLGFFHRWLENLARKTDELRVVCLSEGEHHLPQNVKVYSLGKKRGYSKIRQFFRLQKFLLANLNEADGVFAHMCPIYAILSFPLVKIFKKRMILWYMHKSVNLKLKLAEKCVDKILTASKESCRLKNRKKIEIVGHGIDTDLFEPKETAEEGIFNILCTGRISKIKDQETLIRAADILINGKNFKDIKVKFIGSALDWSEKEYFLKLKEIVEKLGLEDFVEFLGGLPYIKLPSYYQNADLSVNLSQTGSLDKVTLEAMASGCLVLTCNEAFSGILDEKYLFKEKDPDDLAQKIIGLKDASADDNLRKIVINGHNLDNLTDKIILKFNHDQIIGR
ncbi:MAG: glycosyltransferase family 4 protein [Candidatus Nealsonbacteria bacterium]